MPRRAPLLTWWTISHWTWCAPQRWERHRGGRSIRGHRFKPRLGDYALHPEPTLFAEVMRRGFLEGA